MQTDHKPEAERSYQAALELLERLAADFPGIPAYRRELAKGLTNLGVILEKSGRHADAVPHLRRAVALYGPLAADFPASRRIARSSPPACSTSPWPSKS